MTASNRVDDLRKRYHENPRRFFAPLANEYRKTGFIDRAILLCEKHLGEQPGNMNGLVVYGQCLFETGRFEEARAPFEAALAVDPENLIALRHLGDIARLAMDLETARGWYTRVLELDRRNDEVIALLAEVGGGAETSAPPSIAPNIVSVAQSVSVASSTHSHGMVDLDAPTTRPSIAPPVPGLSEATSIPARSAVDPSARTVEVSAQGKPAKRGSLFDLNFDFGESAEASAAPAPAPVPAPAPFVATPRAPQVSAPIGRIIEESEVAEPLSEMASIDGLQLAEFSADVPPLEELESTQFESGDADPLEGLESLEFLSLDPNAQQAIPSIAMDHMSKDALVEVSSAELTLLPDFEEPEPALSRSSALTGLPLLPSLEDAETVRVDIEDLRRRFETPATFVTETMAALYVQQGLHDKAIDVYRQLIVQAPADQGLKDRLRALEQASEHPTEPAMVAAAAPLELEAMPLELEAMPLELEATPLELSAAPLVAASDEFPEFEPESIAATPLSPPSPRTTAPRVTLDFETPVSGDLTVEPPAPANAMLSEMSFADVSLTTPLDLPRPALASSGPSAREFFSAFARRALTPHALMVVSAVPSAAGGPLSPLDEIFGLGVDPNDESSAHRLAAVGATSGPSGGSALDSVFGEGPSAPMPAELPSATPPRGSVPRASSKLRFDQFFASSVGSATPSSAAPVSEAAAAPVPEPETPAAPSDEAPGEDDLDQFQGWLRRLTQ